jgi:SAM-dependent methyltransferase
MSVSIIGLHEGLATTPGAYLLDWERQQLGHAVCDIFGYHALQLGLAQLDALAANRMPHRWLMDRHFCPSLHAQLGNLVALSDFTALPLASSSIDLVVLPHTLEVSQDPHASLREVERILVPEGRLIICGFNPWSLWGMQQRHWRARRQGSAPQPMPEDPANWIAYGRLRDWLRLLSFEVEDVQFGCYRPVVEREAWLKRWAWMDTLGPKWWRMLGAAYSVVAVKRVRGMRIMPPLRKAKLVRVGNTQPAAQQTMDFKKQE